MKRKLLFLSLLLAAIAADAENYPYKSDYLWVTVPDHADWIYQTGEQATVEVQFYKYGIPRDGTVEYGIGNDLMADDTNGKAELKNGRCTIRMGTARKPCFRDLRLRLRLDGTVYQHHVKVGFSPELIRPYTQQPKDFRQFWDEALNEAAQYSLKYTKEPCPEYTTDKTDCYLVKLELNRQHQAFYGYLMIPKNAKPGSCPVVLTPPGAGVKRIKDPGSREYYQEKGVIRFITEIHGMDPRMPESYFEDIRAAFDGRIKGYLYQGIDSRDHYYMKHVYVGLVRCIDMLTSLPEWDGRNVITQGGSQGGALAIIAAALDQRVNLCVANHPALADMAAGAEEGRTHGYPHFTKAEGLLTEAHQQTLPYYDVVCFAPYVKAKTYLTWGFNDNTCPPTTSYAVWNLLQCEKERLITPVNEHWTSDVTNRQQLEWILGNLKQSAGSNTPRSVSDFNFDWKFTLGDSNVYARPSFDDSQWRALHLPHDWSIEGKFSPQHPAGVWGGALPGGIGWYRKHFATPGSETVMLEFDGIYMNSTVFVNGHEVGKRPYGYTSFSYDVTSFLNAPGEDNVVAIRVDNSMQPNSRWYSGSGIYRNVRMVTAQKVHVAYCGTYVTTPYVSDEQAEVAVEVTVDAPAGVAWQVKNYIMDAEGHMVASADGGQRLVVEKPHRWDVSDPYLYTLVTETMIDGRLADRYETTFGIRTMQWDKDKGFLLNGRKVMLRGVCLHHDMGCIGTAVHRRALERQLTIMRDMGVNAIRTSHNPPAPELLQLCDEMGLLVMDEAFDTWRHHKAAHDYAGIFDEWHERDLTDFLRRDRNHPSVIAWSIGNEIYEQSAKTEGEAKANRQLTAHLAGIVKRMDCTRAVTSGTHSVFRENNIINSQGLDVIGLNYHDFGYDSLRQWHPTMPIVASETASALNSRGIYYQPSTVMRIMPQQGPKDSAADSDDRQPPYQCTAYDACHAVWETTCTHQNAWITVRDHPWVAGMFVWTGFDYLGEPTAYGWPARSSYFGIADLAGFPKDPYYMYQAEWTEQTVLHVHPHWNWTEGDSIDVWAYYNNADEVELLVNGHSLGSCRKTPDRLHAFWAKVPYEPGQLTAISYKDGKEVARDTRHTASAPVALRLTADRTAIKADGYDLSFVTIEATDAKGHIVPTADLMLDFKVEGAGELFGVDNGNAADTLCLKGRQMKMFSGKALAVVRSLRNQAGIATLTVSSPIGKAKVKIETIRP